ncbi:ANKRD1 [Symbiodinium sp. CCMP2456]|nr:ANKRD1 [Symbiodinium sp. CCMP2456]
MLRTPEAPPTPPPPPPRRATLSPLLAAAYFGNVEELMDGLREGEDLEAQDPSDGCRPLHAAILTEQTEAASYLIRQRADLESRAFEGLTPLLLACRSDAGRMVRLLLRHSADVAARDASGRSAQDICAEHRSNSAAKALAGEEELEEPQESAESTKRKEQSIAEVTQDDGSTPYAGEEPVRCEQVPAEPWFGSAVDPVEAEGVDPQYEAWDQEIQTGNRPGSQQVLTDLFNFLLEPSLFCPVFPLAEAMAFNGVSSPWWTSSTTWPRAQKAVARQSPH